MLKYLAVSAIAFVGAWVLTPLAQWLAVRIGALDVPNERKVHTQPIPRLGGLALFASFHLAIVAGAYWFWHQGYLMTFLNREWWLGFLCASVIMVGLGAFDDVQRLGARELIIAAENIGPKYLANITTCCARNGVTLRRFENKLDVVLPA